MSEAVLFQPLSTATVSITSATGSANVALPVKAMNAFSLRIKNIDATNIAYVEFGGSTVTASVPNGATPGSMPIGPGETVGVSLSGLQGDIYAASICTAGTPVVYFTPGHGL